MSASRFLLFATSMLASGVWAGWLVILGLWLIWTGLPLSTPLAPPLAAGIFFIAGGQFVFMVLVADRLFRKALTAGRAILELLVVAVMLVSMACIASSVL